MIPARKVPDVRSRMKKTSDAVNVRTGGQGQADAEEQEQKQKAVKSTIVFTTMMRDIEEYEAIRKITCSIPNPFLLQRISMGMGLGRLRLKECSKRSFPTSFVGASGGIGYWLFWRTLEIHHT